MVASALIQDARRNARRRGSPDVGHRPGGSRRSPRPRRRRRQGRASATSRLPGDRPVSWLTDYVRPKFRTLLGKRDVPDNLWVQCDSCNQMVFSSELVRNLRVCPHCGHHMAVGAAERLAFTFDGGEYTRIDLPARAGRPARVSRREALRRPAPRRPRQDRPRRRAGRGGRPDRRHRGRRDRHGVPLHGWLDGGRGRRRDRRRHAPRARAQAAGGHVHLVRRRPHAGGHDQPDADAAHHDRGADAARGATALHRRPDQPDDGRRDRLVRDAGRHPRRRAERPPSASRARG